MDGRRLHDRGLHDPVDALALTGRERAAAPYQLDPEEPRPPPPTALIKLAREPGSSRVPNHALNLGRRHLNGAESARRVLQFFVEPTLRVKGERS